MESDFQTVLDQISQLRVSHDETHQLSWELHKRSKDIVDLQQALSDFQIALFEERKQLLQVVAENDQLKGIARLF